MNKIPFKLVILIDYLIEKWNFIQCALDILSVQGDTDEDNVLKPYSSEDTDICFTETTKLIFNTF